MPCERCHPGGHEYRVESAAHLVGALVGHQRLCGRGLQAERVLDGDEIEPSVLGLGDQVGPVTGRQQVGRPGIGFTPRRRVPARCVEGNREVQSLP